MNLQTAHTELTAARALMLANNSAAANYQLSKPAEHGLRSVARAWRYLGAALACLEVFGEDVTGEPLQHIDSIVFPAIAVPDAPQQAGDGPKSKKASAPPRPQLTAQQLSALYEQVADAVHTIDTWSVNLRGEGDVITSALLVLASSELDEALAKLNEAEQLARMHAFAESVGL